MAEDKSDAPVVRELLRPRGRGVRAPAKIVAALRANEKIAAQGGKTGQSRRQGARPLGRFNVPPLNTPRTMRLPLVNRARSGLKVPKGGAQCRVEPFANETPF